MEQILPLLSKSPKSFYEEEFLPIENADKLFIELNAINGWRVNKYNDKPLNRQTIVFANAEIVDNPAKFVIPPIWGTDIIVIKWPKQLLAVKHLVEKRTGASYNIALGNRYIRAKDAIAFHSDNEEFGNTQSISSISLGVSRTFSFKNKDTSGEARELLLLHGSLLFMGEQCQENYTHGMRKESIANHDKYEKTRINVTFRVWNYEN